MVDASVVIASHNRKNVLCNALASFSKQTYPFDRFEVVVVDDGSSDGTVPYISSLEWPFDLKTVRIDGNKGSSHARNRGVEVAKGNIIVFSDSDMIVPRNYIADHLQCHLPGVKRVVSAPYRRHVFTTLYAEQLTSNLWRKMIKNAPELPARIHKEMDRRNEPFQILFPQDVLTGYVDEVTPENQSKSSQRFLSTYPDLQKCPMPWLLYTSSNSSVARQDLIAIGGFDERLRFRHEDRDLAYRLHRAGCLFAVNHSIVAIHQEHLLDKDRERMTYLSMHDLAIMLGNNPCLDMYLFGLYQTDKHTFNLLFLTKLKQQLLEVQNGGYAGKQDAHRFKHLLRRYVLEHVCKYVNDLPTSKWQRYLTRSPLQSRPESWSLYRRYPEFSVTVDKLTNYFNSKVR